MIATAGDDYILEVLEQVTRQMDARFSACSTSCRESLRCKLETILASGKLKELDSPVGYVRRALKNEALNYFRPFVRWRQRESTASDIEAISDQQLSVDMPHDLTLDIETFHSKLTLVERHALSTLYEGVPVREAAAHASVSEQAIYKARGRVQTKGQHFFRSYKHDRN